jgi:hypothetical protein
MSWLIQLVIRQEEKTDKQSPWWFPSKATPGAYSFLTPRRRRWNICKPNMTKSAKEFLKSTTTKLDEIMAALTPEEQHDLLDALAGEVEER